jgi:hypothetical protein
MPENLRLRRSRILPAPQPMLVLHVQHIVFHLKGKWRAYHMGRQCGNDLRSQRNR